MTITQDASATHQSVDIAYVYNYVSYPYSTHSLSQRQSVIGWSLTMIACWSAHNHLSTHFAILIKGNVRVFSAGDS